MCDSDNDDLPELLDADVFHSTVQTNEQVQVQVQVPSTSRSPPLEPLTDISDVNNFMYIRTPTGLPGWNFTNSGAPVSFNCDDDFKQTSRCSRSRVRTHRHDTGRNQCCSMRIACAIIKENKILIEEVKSLNESILLLNQRLNDLQKKPEADADKEDVSADEDEDDEDEDEAEEETIVTPSLYTRIKNMFTLSD